MATYNFAVNVDTLDDVSTELKKIAEELRTKTTEIYNIIDNDLSQDWQSTAYDEFKTGCHNFEGALGELADMIDMFGTSFSGVGTAADDMLKDIDNRLL